MNASVSKKDLLATAKTLNIKGRHEMTVARLIEAVQNAQGGRTTKPKFIRRGKNPSGNMPYRGKMYFCESIKNEAELKDEPMQVQLLVKFIHKTQITARGGDIVTAAVKAGAIQTKMKDHRVLFGYYAKRLQHFGVTSVYDAPGSQD